MTSTISRRAIARGALWAAPVVAVSTLAPAFAASCGPSEPVRFNASPSTSNTNAPSTTMTDGSTVKSTLSSSGQSNEPSKIRVVPKGSPLVESHGPANVDTRDIGGEARLVRHQTMWLSGSHQTVTIAFPQPVQDVTFTVADFDIRSITLRYDNAQAREVEKTSYQQLYISPFRYCI